MGSLRRRRSTTASGGARRQRSGDRSGETGCCRGRRPRAGSLAKPAITIIGRPHAATTASSVRTPRPMSPRLSRGTRPLAASQYQAGSINSGRNPTPLVKIPSPAAAQPTSHQPGPDRAARGATDRTRPASSRRSAPCRSARSSPGVRSGRLPERDAGEPGDTVPYNRRTRSTTRANVARPASSDGSRKPVRTDPVSAIAAAVSQMKIGGLSAYSSPPRWGIQNFPVTSISGRRARTAVRLPATDHADQCRTRAWRQRRGRGRATAGSRGDARRRRDSGEMPVGPPCRSGRRRLAVDGPRGNAFATDQGEIAQVDEQSGGLPHDEHRIAPVDRIG